MIIDGEKCENCTNSSMPYKDEHGGNDWPRYSVSQAGSWSAVDKHPYIVLVSMQEGRNQELPVPRSETHLQHKPEKGGCDRSLIMKLRGHKTLAMFNRYNTIDRDNARLTMELFDGFLNDISPCF